MNPLANPYVRIALGAALSEYVKPYILRRFVYADSQTADRIELGEEGDPGRAKDSALNDQIQIGVTAAVTTLVFIGLGMATGKTVAGSVAS
jgi:hypothetical protein